MAEKNSPESTEIFSAYIKLPSRSEVTVDKLWKVLEVFAMENRPMDSKDLSEAPNSPSKSEAICSSILDYLRYLGFLEERAHEVEAKRILKYEVVEEAKELVYFVQTSRPEEAVGEWAKILSRHPLFSKGIKLDFFEKQCKGMAGTVTGLQDFLYRSDKGRLKSERYADGAKFLAELFSEAKLLDYKKESGQIIIPRGPAKIQAEEAKPSVQVQKPHWESIEVLAETAKTEAPSVSFTVTVNIIINENTPMELAEAILRYLREVTEKKTIPASRELVTASK
jgi:hypothetical protein